MLRDFLRQVLFERFPQVSGVCVGLAQTSFAAGVVALVGGVGTLRPGLLALAGAGLVAVNVWAVPRIGLSRNRQPIVRLLTQAYLALGFSMIVVASAIAATAIVASSALLLLTPAGSTSETRTMLRWLLWIGSGGVGITVSGALLWGFLGEPRRFGVTRLRVPVHGLDPALAGLRIVHLSDLHIGNGLEDARLARLVAAVNGLHPDLVAITGDIFDHDPAALVDGVRALASLEAPLGVHAVLGNHDLFTGAEAVAAALATHAPEIRLLRGDCLRVPTPAPFYVAGVDDPGRDWTAQGHGLPAIDKIAAAAPNDGPVLLLVHRPDAFPQASRLGFALVLAGHFHGGQIALPGFGGRWNVAAALSPFHRGLYRRAESALYVSRGVGFAGPRIRLGSPPEIAVLELEPLCADEHSGAPVAARLPC